MSDRRIDHVVVLMLENRSFDHMFGFRPGVNGLTGQEFNLLDPTKPESAANPAFHASNAAPFAVPVGKGPLHSLNQTSVQLCNNKDGPSAATPVKNNGFVKSFQTGLTSDHVAHPASEQLQVVMESFASGRLPSISALAGAFCLCDNWYSEVPGPTHPNRLYVPAHLDTGNPKRPIRARGFPDQARPKCEIICGFIQPIAGSPHRHPGDVAASAFTSPCGRGGRPGEPVPGRHPDEHADWRPALDAGFASGRHLARQPTDHSGRGIGVHSPMLRGLFRQDQTNRSGTTQTFQGVTRWQLTSSPTIRWL